MTPQAEQLYDHLKTRGSLTQIEAFSRHFVKTYGA